MDSRSCVFTSTAVFRMIRILNRSGSSHIYDRELRNIFKSWVNSRINTEFPRI